jgi:DNA-directed RNA polymerase specialized sigma24 family protein
LSLFKQVRRREKRGQDLAELRRAGEPVADGGGITVWEDQQWVDELLATLPPQQRAVMQEFLAGSTPTEIAEILGKTPATVRQNLQNARRNLRRQLGREQEVPRQRGMSESRIDGQGEDEQ